MQGASVLVVDDDLLDRDVLVRPLASRGFRVDAVNDAAACMERLEREPPDLVLLDVSMPMLTGVDLLRLMRQRWTAEALPVIMVSGRTDSEDVVAGLEAGANDYVLKPVNLRVLMARMGVALKIRESVRRLLEAERHREKLRALGDACEHLGPPLQRMLEETTRLIDGVAGEPSLQAELRDILHTARQAADLINRFQALSRYRTVPYTEGLSGFVTASLERAVREAAGDQPDPEKR
jgi:PleD family two-component response regulator